MRLPVRVVASLAAAVIAVGGAGTAYAAGLMPDILTPKELVSSAFVERHCGGDPVGRSVKCPNPGFDPAVELPVGDDGTLVALGDSWATGDDSRTCSLMPIRRGSSSSSTCKTSSSRTSRSTINVSVKRGEPQLRTTVGLCVLRTTVVMRAPHDGPLTERPISPAVIEQPRPLEL